MTPRITPSNKKILNYFYYKILDEAGEYSYKVNTRKREYKMLRWVYYKLSMDYSTAGCSAVAHSMGQDHATVIHCIKNFNNELPYEKDIEELYRKLENIYISEVQEIRTINEINDRISKLKNTIAVLEQRKSDISAIHISKNVIENRRYDLQNQYVTS
jgi:hypothetical protein